MLWVDFETVELWLFSLHSAPCRVDLGHVFPEWDILRFVCKGVSRYGFIDVVTRPSS